MSTKPDQVQAWAILKRRARLYIPRAWILHSKNLVSLVDPRRSRLGRICEVDAVEQHSTEEWAFGDDADSRRIFSQLLNGALIDDLRLHDVSYAHKDKVFFCRAREDGRPRKISYQNVTNRSTITVVNNYKSRAANGRVFRYMRHLAFSGRFLFRDGEWCLEIVPTYRFTFDGYRKDRFHEQRLKGIKRLERNRAVLSQVLLWNHVLTSRPEDGEFPRLLRFGKVPHFRIEIPGYQDAVQRTRSTKP